MGHKVHPGGLRVGIIHTWKSNWFTTSKEFSGYLSEDFKIRDHIYGKLSHAGLSDIHIRKDKQKVTVDIYTARPGIVIGKSGSEVDALRKELHDMTGKAVQVNITEIKRPELDAKLVAQSIAEQLQNRVSFRRAMKRSLSSSMRSGAQGVKIRCGGRLGGAEMSRTESYSEGRVPLHTLRADIDYGFAEAKTTFGRIGVKVWINKGEIMPEGFERDAAGTRLGEVDTRRRRGGRPGDAEQLGPARPQRRSGGGSGGGGGRDGGGRGRRPRQGQNDPAQSGDPNAGAGGRRARPRPPAAPAAAEAVAPETAAPETAAPETAAAPEAAAPEAAAPEAAAPESAAPETAAAPEAAAPEAAAPEAAAPEAAVVEPAAPKKAPAKKPAAKKPAAKKPAAEKAEKPAPEQPAAEAAAPEAPEGGDA
jgi:small subunit ribosomal protein S3